MEQVRRQQCAAWAAFQWHNLGEDRSISSCFVHVKDVVMRSWRRPDAHAQFGTRRQLPGQCHVNLAEGCHLYIAVTGDVSTI